MMRTLLAALVVLALPSLAFADDKKAATLFPGSLDLPIADGATIPGDCFFPARLRNANHYDLACVVMPRSERASQIGAEYLGLLGQRGWREGAMVIGGMSAVKPADNGCHSFLGIYPHDFPPAATPSTTTTQSANVVIWFALDRQPHCESGAP